MPNYDLDRLGEKEFERMCQSLLKFVIGSGTITFGEGRDGGREATFSGAAPYPSAAETWNGNWIFQAKYHNVKLIGGEESRRQVLNDLRSELDKIVNKYKYKCNNYILITNVPLSSVSQRGSHDRIALEVAPEFVAKIPHIHVWGADDLYRFLERFSELRHSYMHFITPGDLIAELMDRATFNKSKLVDTIRLYLRTCFNQEQYAQLDQAGEVGEERMPLQRVFIDLDVTPRYEERTARLPIASVHPWLLQAAREKKPISAMRALINEAANKITLIGGPGQGKSTLGQYLSQIHRATLLDCLGKLNNTNKLVPLVARIPFRVILKEYAQWILDTKAEKGLEYYLAYNVKERAARDITAEDVQEIIKNNPCLLIFDGLDEVTDRVLRINMLDQIKDFLDRSEDILSADIQVLATSRPTGYNNQFDPSNFFHLNLTTLTTEKVTEYVDRWVAARAIDRHKATQLKNSIKECADDRQVQLLMNTPLQVTILVLIILSGGTPPKQREGLFDEYLEVIYKREKTKAKWMIQTEKSILFGLHKYLGYLLHSSATGDHNVLSSLKESAFIKEVQEFLRFNDPFSPATEIDKQVDLIVKEARDRLVLIVELASGDFGFELRSLQEFFAAGHLADTAKNSKQRYERFEAISRAAHWRNVSLFFAGRVGRVYEGEAANILEVCKDIDRQEPDLFLRRGAWLALDLASDRSFGPNRRLQRSLIEYCLPLLETEINKEQVNSFIHTISRIPPEDARDHLRPVLEEKLKNSQLPFLESYLDIFSSIYGKDEVVLNQLDNHLQDKDDSSTSWAINKALSYEIAPQWLSARLKHLIPDLTPVSFAETFFDKLLSNPSYARDCLTDCHVDIEKIGTLLSKLFSGPFYLNRVTGSKLDEFTVDLSSPYEQLWTSASMLRLLYITTEHRRFRASSRRAGYRWLTSPLTIKDFLHEAKIHEYIKNIDSISELVKDENLPLQMRAILWTYHVILNFNLSDTLKQFVNFYSSNKRQSPWLEQFVRRFLSPVHPLFKLLLDAIDESTTRVALLIDLISNFDRYEQQIDVFVNKVEDWIRINGTEAISYLNKAAVFGQAVVIRPDRININDLERETGIPFEIGFPLLQFHQIHSPQLTLTGKEVYLILDGINSQISSHVDTSRILRTWWNLNSANWKGGDGIKYIITELTATLNNTELDENLKTLAVSLCIKQIISDLHSDDISRQLFSIIGRNSNLEVSMIDVWNIKDSAKTLAVLQPYTEDADSIVQSTAIKLAAEVIKDVEESQIYFHNNQDEVNKLFRKTIFKSKVVRDYIENISDENRIDGIRLLVISDFKIAGNGDWVLNAFKSCSNDKEAEAWSFLIKYARVTSSAKALKEWLAVMTAILKDKYSYHPIIRRATLESYERVVRNRESRLKIDEEYLNLPLNKEAPELVSR